MPVPNTFASATTSIPLAQLDANFATPITLGNTVIQLGNTVSTIGNITLSNVTITSGAISANVSNATTESANVVGYMGIPQNIQSGNYNVVLGDSGKHIYHAINTAPAVYTFPANSNVAFSIGSAVTIINGSANNITISLTSDTMYLAGNGATGSRTLTQFGIATAVKVTSNSWLISGTNLI